jgi:hypothetical protein
VTLRIDKFGHIRSRFDLFPRINFFVALFVTTRGSFLLDHQDPLRGWNQSSNFFLHQINALIDGHWWVEPNQLLGECFLRDEKCLSYFGLTPSIVRIPFLSLLDHYNTAGSAYFIAAALTLASNSFWMLAKDVAPTFLNGSFFVRLTTAFLIGPASLLYFGSRTSVYHESIAWSIAFASLSLRRYWLWAKNSSHKNMIFLVIALSLSAGTHPGILPLATVLAIAVGIHLFANNQGVICLLVSSGSLLLVPSIVSFGTILLKFGTPFFDGTWHQSIPEDPYWAKILLENGGRVTALKFIPVQLYSALRIDGLAFDQVWPWVSIRFSWQTMSNLYQTPFHKDGIAFTEAVSGANFAPVQFGFLLVSIFMVTKHIFARKISKHDIYFDLGLLSSISYLLIVLMQVQVAQRYMTYFYIPTTFGFIYILREIEHRWQIVKLKRAYLFISSLGVIWTLFIGFNFYFSSSP